MASEPEYWEDAIISAQLGKAARFYAVENERQAARIAALEAENRRLVVGIVKYMVDDPPCATDCASYAPIDRGPCDCGAQAFASEARVALAASTSSEGRPPDPAASPGDPRVSITCRVCGEVFRAFPRAMYCTNRCKNKAIYRRAKARAALASASSEGRALLSPGAEVAVDGE